MRIYFDTNVYSMVVARGEVAAMRAFLNSAKCSVLASTRNLIESFAIPDIEKRHVESGAIGKIASAFEDRPSAFKHARELRLEIGRLRPKWLRVTASQSSIRRYLRGHQSAWQKCRDQQVPTSADFAAYRRDAEGGIERVREGQKAERSAKRDALRLMLASESSGGGALSLHSEIDLKDPEKFWRADALTSWHAAIVERAPASRDYFDYLGPYLKDNAFGDRASYLSFWLNEVDAGRLARNRLTSLVSFFQLDSRSTHGNPGDAIHANHLLDVDLFVTADKAFAKSLDQVRSLVPGAAVVKLIDRSRASAVAEIAQALE